tara:strand:+ start:439 stop:570 length:132 start_codon:yes stop_codon:yes gene_type:complete
MDLVLGICGLICFCYGAKLLDDSGGKDIMAWVLMIISGIFFII